MWCAKGHWVSTKQSWVWIWVVWLHLYHSHHACGEYELINYSTLVLMNLPVLQKQESWELTSCQDSLAAWVLQEIQVWPRRWIPMTFGRETEAEAHSWCFCTFMTSMLLKHSLFLWSLQQWSLYSVRLACCCTFTVLVLVWAGMCGFRSSRRGIFLTMAKEVKFWGFQHLVCGRQQIC